MYGVSEDHWDWPMYNRLTFFDSFGEALWAKDGGVKLKSIAFSKDESKIIVLRTYGYGYVTIIESISGKILKELTSNPILFWYGSYGCMIRLDSNNNIYLTGVSRNPIYQNAFYKFNYDNGGSMTSLKAKGHDTPARFWIFDLSEDET